MANTNCDICGGDPNKCEEQNTLDNNKQTLAYDATQRKSSDNQKNEH